MARKPLNAVERFEPEQDRLWREVRFWEIMIRLLVFLIGFGIGRFWPIH